MRPIALALVVLALPAPAAAQEEIPRAVLAPDGRVRFQYLDPFAGKVEVGGQFNGWNPSQTPMAKGETGVWTADVSLEPGRHEYKFVIDGQWEGGDNKRVTVVRGKGGAVEILAEEPTYNTPYNSRIYFGGRAWAQPVVRKVNPDENADTGRWRLAPMEYDLSWRMRFTAGANVSGYAELDLNNSEDRFQTNFDEGEAVYSTENLTALAFRRRRAVEFDDPLYILDPLRDTLDEEIYLTFDDRGPLHRFGRRFDFITRNREDNDFNYTLDGYQGGLFDASFWGFRGQGFAATRLAFGAEDVFGGRLTRGFFGDALRLGFTGLAQNQARGLIAAPNGGNSTIQRSVFIDTNGGVFNFPPASGQFPNYDMIALLDPDGPNRDEWYGYDARLRLGWWDLFLEGMTHKKDWSFVAWEDGDGAWPDGSAHYQGAPNLGEFLVGGQGEENTILLGGVWRPFETFGAEISWRLDDASELTLNDTGTLERIRPERNTYTFRAKYAGETLRYALEATRVSAKSFPRTFVQASFDDRSFQDVDVVGVFDRVGLQQNLRWTPGSRWTLDLVQIYRRYDLLSSRLETSEIRGAVSLAMTQRLRGALGARWKYYNLPKAEITTTPGLTARFFAPSLRLIYAISPYISLSFGYGVDFRNDEDLEEGRLFFLREGLARARRPNAGTTHTLDQILRAEEILEDETRLELELDARF